MSDFRENEPKHNLEAEAKEALQEMQEHKTGVLRTLFAGGLMGLANVIPGVSGGTIILALGLYEKFVNSVAEITRFRFRFGTLLFLGLLGVAAIVAIGLMARPIEWGLTYHHHLMFALFIGLTLGGVPVVWKEMGRLTPAAVAGAAAGVLVMVGVFLLNYLKINLPQTWIIFLVMGIIASAAMVLPGLSGSYILLVAGLYLPIIAAIREFRSALTGGDFATVWEVGWGVGAPVALGIVIGIAGLTNLLKTLLKRYHAPTLGVLLGLLIGSVIGLYPFGTLMDKGDVIAEAHPATAMNVALVLVAIVAGFAVTVGVSRLGGGEDGQESRGDTEGKD